ncbi:MAG: hypothetical protein Q4G60_09960 [bacterium]|nr:hypothetical protein [bacterium]
MEQLTHQLRKSILERYGMDIEEAQVHYSTRNYVYVFPTDNILRVSAEEQSAKPSEREAELTFLLDISHHCKTVCIPKPSLKHHYIELIKVDEKFYPVCSSDTLHGI